MKENLCIETIEIFEWYDGVVLGLFFAENRWFLTCLLAFNPDTQKKRYLLASLSQEQMTFLKSIYQQHGVKSFNKIVLSSIINKSQNIYLTFEEPESGGEIKLSEANSLQKARLPELSFPIIDGAVMPSAISQWLSD